LEEAAERDVELAGAHHRREPRALTVAQHDMHVGIRDRIFRDRARQQLRGDEWRRTDGEPVFRGLRRAAEIGRRAFELRQAAISDRQEARADR
jgi:hypothetical protein